MLCCKRPAQHRPVDRAQNAHHRIVLLAMQLAANQEGAQDRHQRDGEDGGAHHREGLGERQRVKHLAFHAGQRKHRNERQNDDHHGEEDRPADELGGIPA